MTSYASTDLSKLKYCEVERDQCEDTVYQCEQALNDCQAVDVLIKEENAKQKEIIDTQTKEVASQSKEIKDLKEGSTFNKILFGILGVVVGLVLHIPLAAIVK